MKKAERILRTAVIIILLLNVINLFAQFREPMEQGSEIGLSVTQDGKLLLLEMIKEMIL